MGTRLVVCVHCDRHVRRSEHACPFCGKALPAQPRIGTAVVATSVVAVAMMGCGAAQPLPAYGPAPVEDPAPPDDPAPPVAEEPVEDGEVPAPVPEAETPPETDEGRGVVALYAAPPSS